MSKNLIVLQFQVNVVKGIMSEILNFTKSECPLRPTLEWHNKRDLVEGNI